MIQHQEHKLRGSSSVASFDKVLRAASAAIVGGSHKEDECEDFPKKKTEWCNKAHKDCCSTEEEYDDNFDFCDFYGFDEAKGIVGDTQWSFSTEDVDCNKCDDEQCDDNKKKHNDDDDDDDHHHTKHDDDDDDSVDPPKKSDDKDGDDDKKHDDEDDDHDKKQDDKDDDGHENGPNGGGHQDDKDDKDDDGHENGPNGGGQQDDKNDKDDNGHENGPNGPKGGLMSAQ